MSNTHFGLPGRYYTSRETFDIELEQIFYSRWLCALRADQLAQPGAYARCDIGTESVLIVRDGQGALHGFHNVCRHRGSRLCFEPAGKLGHSIQCHYHAWTYALDGRLIGAPHMNEDPTFERSQYGLMPVPLVEWEGFVLVNLSPQPAPFEQSFAPLIDKFTRWHLPELRVGGRREYQVAANWKLIFENYNECYHCPLVHPALASRSPYRSGENDLTTGPFLGGPMQLIEELGSLTMSGNSCAPTLGDLRGADCHQVYYYSIFPNLLLSLHPDYVMAHTVWPVGADQTRITCEWLFAPEAFDMPGFNPNDAIEFWDMTNRQDWYVCETTQQGVSSRAYRPGPFSPLESIPVAFDEEYLRAIGELVGDAEQTIQP